MNREEITNLYNKAAMLDKLDAKELRIVGMIKDELSVIQDQDTKNRIVNKVAAVLRDEFGTLTKESSEYLESVRVGSEDKVSIRTMEKRLKAARDAEKEAKKENE